MVKNDEVLIAIDNLLRKIFDVFMDLNLIGAQFFDEEKYDKASEIATQIETISSFQAKIHDLREEWSQLKFPSVPEEPQPKNKIHRKQSKTLKSGLRTPNETFHIPILVAIIELGGSGSVQAVLDRVHVMMKDQLNEYDYKSIPSNAKVIRWENNAQWARLKLVKEGYLASGSPRGVWEITKAGRQRVAESLKKDQMDIAEPKGQYTSQQPKLTKERFAFEIGKVYHRQKDLHHKFGGNRQSGISPCSRYPIIFLFTSSTGDEFGYEDGWRSENEYIYTGEGQVGDMEMLRANRAIRDHEEDQRALHLFKSVGSGLYEYMGEFRYQDHEIVRGEDANGKVRDMIRFILSKVY